MRKIASILFLFIAGYGYGQTDVRESVYLHLNSTFLLTGETLYLSAYVTSQATGLPSDLSKILYVEMVDQENKPVFQKKVLLQDGRGYADFFVSSLLSTGKYRLIAYTRWMKNFDDYFQTAVSIVNPFEAYSPVEVDPNAISLEFFISGGDLVRGVPAHVVYRALDENQSGVSISGRVVDADGNKAADISSASGIGHFDFVPENSSYQAIIEAGDDFLFFKLSAVKPFGTAIQLLDDPGYFRFKTYTQLDGCELVVTDGQNVPLRQAIHGQEAISLEKKNLKPGIYQAQVVRNDEVVAIRTFASKGMSGPETRNTLRATQRAKVELPVGVNEEASVSVSVRLMEKPKVPAAANNFLFQEIGEPALGTSEALDDFLQTLQLPTFKATSAVSLLPELRGELISGTVVRKTRESDLTSTISFSVSGTESMMWPGKIDTSGRFTIRIDPIEGGKEGVARVLEENELDIVLDNQFLDEYPPIFSAGLDLDSLTIQQLAQRSVQNQVENAYFELKTDSSTQVDYWATAFGRYDFSYNLDDYNRFPELYEYFVEYIPTVIARKNKKRSKIKVMCGDTPGELDPLILLDGLPVTAYELLEVNPYLIESIRVMNSRVFWGSIIADGLLNVSTYERNLKGFTESDPNLLRVEYKGTEPLKVYQFPTYESGNTLDRVPDFRTQLFWQPDLKIEGNTSATVSFFTSDIAGEYEIRIEGFTASGKPISIVQGLIVSED